MEPDEEKQAKMRTALENARLITMINGLGLAMIGLKNSRSSIVFLPTFLLMVGTVLFPGVIFYEAIVKNDMFHGFIKFGGMASIFGYFAMALI